MSPSSKQHSVTLTEELLEHTQAENPRTQEILKHLVYHLHVFIKEFKPTADEWFTAIDFLTRTGKK